MNNSVNSNIYTFSATTTLTRFATHVEGNVDDVVLVISQHVAGPAVREALAKSMERLGYGAHSIAWTHMVANEATLNAQDLRSLTEGLDPLVLVTTDTVSTNLLAQAYNIELPACGHTRILGRETACLPNFEAMLQDTSEKQRAWHTLKQLGRED